jgi:hypothetical protein
VDLTPAVGRALSTLWRGLFCGASLLEMGRWMAAPSTPRTSQGKFMRGSTLRTQSPIGPVWNVDVVELEVVTLAVVAGLLPGAAETE